jgi:glycosyltransferase involved in cell wall biosynthesis
MAVSRGIALMRILHVTPTYLPARRYGGPIYSVHGLCRALARRGHEVHVFTTSVDGPADSPVPLGVPVERDGVRVWYFRSPLARRLYWSPGLGRALRAQVASFDVAHVHAMFLWPTLAACRAARAAGVPHVLAPRGMLAEELFRQRGRLRKRLWVALFDRANVERADAVHVTSEAEAIALRQLGLAPAHVEVVPNGIEPAPAGAGVARRDDVVLYLGRLHPIKGLERLVDAVAEVPGCELWLAGNDEGGHRARLEQLVAAHGLGARVRFLGPVGDEAKHELYRQAAVFVLPSLSESFGNAALEAMAHGCPVVVTPGVGLARPIREAGAGRVCPAESLAGALRELLADPARRRAFAERGLQLVSGYSWDAVAGRVERLYQRIATRAAAA